MEIAIKVIIGTLVFFYIVLNILTAKYMSASQMKKNFVTGQCFVGGVFANIFYAPAWALKAIRVIVITAIK